MNKEALDNRMAELVALEQQKTQQVLQLQADLQAINGAKQDVQYWLMQLEESAAAPTQNSLDFVPMQETAPSLDAA